MWLEKGNQMSSLKPWAVGAFLTATLIGFGMLFGAVGVAVYSDPAAFLDSISNVQGILAAVIALIAAAIAYKAQTAKVESDATTRMEDREALGEVLQHEIHTRAVDMLLRIQTAIEMIEAGHFKADPAQLD